MDQESKCECVHKPVQVSEGKYQSLRDKIASDVNSISAENGSNTPDFILAEYLIACLKAFDAATNRREKWYNRDGSEMFKADGSILVRCPT